MNQPLPPSSDQPLPAEIAAGGAGAGLGREPLSWVLGEIRAALTLSSASLQEAADQTPAARVAAMLHAGAYLHQAQGALLMLEISGVAMVTAQVEVLFEHIRNGTVILDPALAHKVDLAYQAVYEYLDELEGGAPHQPVRLFPYYRDLLEARGAERIHPADLFFREPVDPPVLPAAAPGEAAPDYPLLRQRFEKSLLHFLKTSDPDDGAVMARVMQDIAVAQSQPAARAFWWVLRGFAHAVASRQVPNDMLAKQLFGRINKKLRKLGEIDFVADDEILHDALFFIARAPHPSALLRQVRDAYRLEGLVPFDFDKKRYGLIDLGALSVARERLTHAKSMWGRLVHGDQAVASSFEHDLDSLVEACEKLQSAPLSRLMVQLSAVARQAIGADKNETLSLEIATGFLVVESALKDIRRLPEHFTERTDAMTGRLRLLGTGAPAKPSNDIMEDSSRQAQQQAMGALAQEMQSGLLEVERILDGFFRRQSEASALAHVVPLLHQIEGALAILDQDAAVRALQHTQITVAGLSDNPGAPQQNQFELLAQNIGALGLFMDALRHNAAEAKKRFVFNQSSNVFHMLQADDVAATVEVGSPADVAENGLAGGLPDRAQAGPASPALELDKMPAAAAVPAVATQSAAPAAAADSAAPAPASAASGSTTPAAAAISTSSSAITPVAISTSAGAVAPAADDAGQAPSMPAGDAAGLTSAGIASQEAPDSPAAQAFLPEFDLNATLPVVPLTPGVSDGIAQQTDAAAPAAGPAREFTLGETAEDAASAVGSGASVVASGTPDLPAFPVVERPVFATAPAFISADNEATLHIGSLQISAPLYNIYCAETSGLLAVLAADLQDWRHAPERYVNVQAVHAAHSLAGSSATVGLTPVHDVAYAIETILQHLVRKPVQLGAADFDLLLAGVDSIGKMLAQFAQGELPAHEPHTVAVLEEIFSAIGKSADRQEAAREEADGKAASTETGVAPQPALPQALLVDAFLVSRFEGDTAALQDAPDPDLLPIFVEEARDLLPQIGRALREWRRAPEDSALMQSLQRLAHTMKGSARMAGAMRLGQHMHHMEARVENCLHAGPLSPQIFDDLLQHHDRALQLFEQLIAVPEAAVEIEMPSPAGLPAKTSMLPAPVAAPLVRVRADILDRLVNQAGEVSISRSRLETEVGVLRQSLADLNDNVARLREQLREVEIQAESQINAQIGSQHPQLGSLPGVAGKFDALEFDRYTRLQELTRMMAESVNDVSTVQQTLFNSLTSASSDLALQGRMTRDLQQDLMRVRMVQFGSLSDRLYRVVRQTAKDLGKRVNLDIRGAGLEVDRGVLDRMVGPFEHLLRNAIVHGIEGEVERAAAGKREAGDLVLDVRQDGNEVVLQFSDDGCGLDLVAIRVRAIEHGWLAEDAMITDAELGDLVFRSGFSTAQEVTQSAGRGIGMDVVRTETAALGGTVAIASDAGRGMRVTIRLPLTLAVTQVVLLSTGGRQFALPSILVEQVVQLKSEAFAAAYHEGAISWQGQRVTMAYLSTLLGERRAAPVIQQYAPVIIVKNGGQRLAVHVDTIYGNREVVVKNIGPQLARIPGMSGATVLGTGEIILIINPLQLIERDPALQPAEVLAPPQVKQAQVMVVDDSLTVRRVSQRMLLREGYQVLLAKDGVDAMEQLQSAMPDVILLDIEMPRMDGFDFTRRVKADARLREIPIIVITSRTAAKHRQMALELGVNGYFGKPFQEGPLLEAIAAILKREPLRDVMLDDSAAA